MLRFCRLAVLVPVVAMIVAARPSPACAEKDYGIAWHDDMSSAAGWTTVDHTVVDLVGFHIDSYLAYDDQSYEDDLSWWCGCFDYDADGGYGNHWDQTLELPPIYINSTTVERMTWGGIKSLYRAEPFIERTDGTGGRPAGLGVLTWACRYDSERDYDFTHVEAESLGVWRSLYSYDGQSGGWTGAGYYGAVLVGYDDPLRIRFHFVSDEIWSDQDGQYDSVGGAFHVDNIRVYDYYTGDTYFHDDVQSGSPCVPGCGSAAGDLWHLVDDVCSSNEPPCWWCGDDADTSHIPPNLHNSLISPVIYRELDAPCTLRMLVHTEVPPDGDDWWLCEVSTDGGVSWCGLCAYGHDSYSCSGFVAQLLEGLDISPLMPTSSLRIRVTFYTSDDGCGPGVTGSAGVNVDDIWVMAQFEHNEGTVYPESEYQAMREVVNAARETPASPFRHLYPRRMGRPGW